MKSFLRILAVIGLLFAAGRTQAQTAFTVSPQPVVVPMNGSHVEVTVTCNFNPCYLADGNPSVLQTTSDCSSNSGFNYACPQSGDGPVPPCTQRFGFNLASGSQQHCLVEVYWAGPSIVYTTQNATFYLCASIAGPFGCPQHVNINLTVAATPPTSITVAPANTAIGVGQTQQFTATGHYADGSTFDLTPVVTWTAANGASINSSGLATGTSAGTATITASYVGVSGSTNISVTQMAQGRWQFNVIDGYTPFQIANLENVQNSLWLNVDSAGGISNGNNVAFTTTDCLATETGQDSIVTPSNGSRVNADGSVEVIETLTNQDGTLIIFNYSGQLNAAGDQITGTYTASTVGFSCPYLPLGGHFIAQHLPNIDSISNTFVGTFSAPLDQGEGPDNIGATIHFYSDPSANRSEISGDITLITPFVSPTNGAACLTAFPTGETLKFDDVPTPVWNMSDQTAIYIEMYAHDAAGVNVYLLGYSQADPNGTNGPLQADDMPNSLGEVLPAAPGMTYGINYDQPATYFNGGIWRGTNQALYLGYEIFGGNCNGLGGGDGPFQPVINGRVPHWQPNSWKGNKTKHGKKNSVFERRMKQIEALHGISKQ